MNSKIAGGILLIVGTCIGAGMLALPIAAAGGGFIYSSLLLVFFWAITAFSAFLILEVNLWFAPRNNLITMARETLGKPGEIITWVTYILLLYSLLAAYISGGSALFSAALNWAGIAAPAWVSSLLFVLIFGYIVYRGITPIDYVNRALMTAKLASLFILIFFAIPYVDMNKLMIGDSKLLTVSVMVMATSFGYATIIPSLRSYFNGNVKQLRLTILIGSLIPLVCYLLWNFAIIGALPRTGENGLLEILHRGGTTTELTQSLSYYLHNSSITTFANFFATICVLTSFLGVSLGLSDFLADGLKIQKVGKGNLTVTLVTYLPPLLVVVFYPSIFIKAISYAGLCCIVLLMLLPALMTWSGRYRKQFSVGKYQVAGGRVAIILLIVVAVLLTVWWLVT